LLDIAPKILLRCGLNFINPLAGVATRLNMAAQRTA